MLGAQELPCVGQLYSLLQLPYVLMFFSLSVHSIVSKEDDGAGGEQLVSSTVSVTVDGKEEQVRIKEFVLSICVVS